MTFSSSNNLTIFVSILWIAFCSQARPSTVPQFLLYPTEDGSYTPAIIYANAGEKFLFFNEPEDLEQHVHFLLYTNENPTTPQELTIGDVEALKDSNFDPSLPAKILVHGFTNSDKIGFPPVARTAYFNSNSNSSSKRSLNLFIVDWGKLCRAPWYSTAARNTRLVGVKLARFIEFLVEHKTPIERIHVIGHSLGAHVAGFAGSQLNIVNLTLSRITALDPAFPNFEEVSDENRIDPSDAFYVDVIHTAGGSSSSSSSRGYYAPSFESRVPLAFFDPRGHADFYVNGGRKQPGCGLDLFGGCSHLRSYEYYLESLENPKGFKSCECDDWDEYQSGKCHCSNVAFMGEECSSSVRGLFFLRTGPRKPYAATG